ncbi:MAG: DNA-directed RNA polymerase subunit omega [Rickettsiales bacterium]|jgi:DNA-directed RNA polymerase subunit omega|nr:DNA-directed RNA polymerase subunit omega [Rickettsiales bacterium]
MARVTVEDCKKVVPDHFELVVLASRRGRDIGAGSPILVEKSNDKNAVVALREIAAKKLNVELLRSNIIQDYRKNLHIEDSLDDNKTENYIESDEKEANQFASSFEDELSEGMSSIELAEEFEEEISFEDENIEPED